MHYSFRTNSTVHKSYNIKKQKPQQSVVKKVTTFRSGPTYSFVKLRSTGYTFVKLRSTGYPFVLLLRTGWVHPALSRMDQRVTIE